MRDKIIWFLDWCGRCQLVYVFFTGATVTGIISAILEAPGYYILGLGISGGLLFVGAALLYQQSRLMQIEQKPHMPEPEDAYVGLKEAARKLYEESRHNRGKLAREAEQMSGFQHGGPTHGSPDDILHWVARTLLESGEVDLYGVKPPSTILEKISERDAGISP